MCESRDFARLRSTTLRAAMPPSGQKRSSAKKKKKKSKNGELSDWVAPSVDVAAVLHEWCEKNGLVGIDVSEEVKNDWDGVAIGAWQASILARAMSHPLHVYFVVAVARDDGFCNLEGMAVLRRLVDMTLALDRAGTRGVFHFMAYRNDDFMFGCDIRRESQIMMGMEALLSSECPVCLEPLNCVDARDAGNSSVCLFKCNHPLHFRCGIELDACPTCRESKKSYRAGAADKDEIESTIDEIESMLSALVSS